MTGARFRRSGPKCPNCVSFSVHVDRSVKVLAMTLGMVTGMATHVGVYGRQSMGRENGSEVSTVTQREAGIERARTFEPEHIELYEDLGLSAFKAEVTRKDFDRLIADCKAGRINVIVVYYISRLSRREPLEIIPLVTELLHLGVVIVSVTEGEFRKNNVMDLIHLIMRLDAAYQESKNKSEAVTSAKKKARQLGGYVGGTAPYGFMLKAETRFTDAGKPIVVQIPYHEPTEAANIRQVWATIRRHFDTPTVGGKTHPGSLSGICIQMNDDAIPTRGQRDGKDRKDSRWGVSTLKRILMDPRIAGFEADPVFGVKEDGTPSTRVKSYRIRRDPETAEPIKFCEPIIPPAEWYELQAWLETRDRGRGLARGTSLLSGLRTPESDAVTQCECGRPFGSLNVTSKTSNPAYRCTRPRGGEYPGQHTGGVTIAQEYADEYVARRIFALIQAAERDADAGDVMREAARRFGSLSEPAETAQERRALVAERADAVRALEELYDERDEGGFRSAIGRRRFLKAETAANDRLEATEHRLAALGESDVPVLPLRQWLPDSPDVDPIGPGSWWHQATLEERRAFVVLFVERITVRKGTIRGGRRNDPLAFARQVAERMTITWAQAPDYTGSSVDLSGAA